MGRKKKKNFRPQPPTTPPPIPPIPTPSPIPTPAPIEPPGFPIAPAPNDSSKGPSTVQRAANSIASSLFGSGVSPIGETSRKAIDDTLGARASIVEVERRLLAYFAASFDAGSLKPVEAAALARSLAATISTRRKIELAELDEGRKKETHPSLQKLRELQAAKLAKSVNQGRLYPEADPNEVSPEKLAAPKGFDEGLGDD